MRLSHRATIIFCVSALLSQTAVLSQTAPTPANDVLLIVGGEVERPLRLSAADLARLPRLRVRAADHGEEATFEGVALHEVLRLAGVRFGEEMRGERLAYYLVVEAADRYRAVFALPEIDPAFTDRIILLADRRDGRPLSAAEGRLRIVVPNERRHARWVRQVITLTVRRA